MKCGDAEKTATKSGTRRSEVLRIENPAPIERPAAETTVIKPQKHVYLEPKNGYLKAKNAYLIPYLMFFQITV